MTFKEAEMMLEEYEKLREFFAKYNEIKKEYESLDETERKLNDKNVDDSCFTYQFLVIDDYSNTLVNSYPSKELVLYIIARRKDELRYEVQKLSKEYGIE